MRAHLVLCLLLAGCTGLPSLGGLPSPGDSVTCVAPGGGEIPQPPWLGINEFPSVPGQAWDHLVFEGPLPVGLRAQPWQFIGHNVSAPPGWDAQVDVLAGAEVGERLLRLRLEPRAAAEAGDVTWYREHGWSTEDGGSCRVGFPSRFTLEQPAPAETGDVGRGVLVRTAGFLDDGRLFYTNIAALDNTDWPRVDWYAWGNGDALAVYIYDKDGSERPDAWRAGVHEDVAGHPVDAPLWNYVTTIPGFNEALKGLAVGTIRVAHFDAEDGYTRPGNEEHHLYGHDLTFLIQVIAVHEGPCLRHDQPCVPVG